MKNSSITLDMQLSGPMEKCTINVHGEDLEIETRKAQFFIWINGKPIYDKVLEYEE